MKRQIEIKNMIRDRESQLKLINNEEDKKDIKRSIVKLKLLLKKEIKGEGK